MNREMAVEIAKRIERAFAHMNEAIGFVQTRLDEDDLEIFHGHWSQVVGELDLGVLEAIYRAYPDLRPEGMTPVAPLTGDETPPREAEA